MQNLYTLRRFALTVFALAFVTVGWFFVQPSVGITPITASNAIANDWNDFVDRRSGSVIVGITDWNDFVDRRLGNPIPAIKNLNDFVDRRQGNAIPAVKDWNDFVDRRQGNLEGCGLDRAQPDC